MGRLNALLPLVLAVGLRLPTSLTEWMPFVVMSILNNVLPFTFITFGQKAVASGLASVLNSRAYTIGILLAWRMAVGPILASIGALGIYRAAVPDVGFDRLAPSALQEYVTGGSGVGVSRGASVLVLLLWTAAAAD